MAPRPLRLVLRAGVLVLSPFAGATAGWAAVAFAALVWSVAALLIAGRFPGEAAAYGSAFRLIESAPYWLLAIWALLASILTRDSPGERLSRAVWVCFKAGFAAGLVLCIVNAFQSPRHSL